MNRRNLIAGAVVTVAVAALPTQSYAAMADIGPQEGGIGNRWYTETGCYEQLWGGYDFLEPDKFKVIAGAPVPTGSEFYDEFLGQVTLGHDTTFRGKLSGRKRGDRLFTRS